MLREPAVQCVQEYGRYVPFCKNAANQLIFLQLFVIVGGILKKLRNVLNDTAATILYLLKEAVMKLQKQILLGCATALLLAGVGSDPACAIDVSVRNTMSENVYVMLWTRSDYSWETYATIFGKAHQLTPGAVYTFSVPVDSMHRCPSYLDGYNEGYAKYIKTMDCNGTEVSVPTARCCVNSNFEVYKQTDGTLHFRKK